MSALDLRRALKKSAILAPIPSALEDQVRRASTPRWLRLLTESITVGRSAIAVAALILLAVFLTMVTRPPVDVHAANAMDRLALRLDDSSPVVVEGTVLCRDCELEHRYGIKSSCKQIGHHGAIFTVDGRILNIVEQRSSASLIHDETLFGRKVIVRGRLFRSARALVVESYQLGG